MKKYILLFAATFLNFLLVNIKAQTIYTFAGNGTIGFSGDGGPATAAQFDGPNSIVFDASGNAYVLEGNNRRVRKVNTSGIISTIAGNGTYGFSGDGGPATAAQFNNPLAIGIDAMGNLYVVDNMRLRKINTAGIITTIAGNATAGFSGDGGPSTAAQLNNPAGVCADNTGNIYIADAFNNRIRKINSSGIISTVVGNGALSYGGDGGPATAAMISGPTSITFDASGNMFFIDDGNNIIRKVNTSGIISRIAGVPMSAVAYGGDGGPATAAYFAYPKRGLAVDATGNLYISDQWNQRIRKVNTSGIINTIAGNGTAWFGGDGGPATAAMINYPLGLAINGAGNLFIVDPGNNRVRGVGTGTSSVDYPTLSNKLVIVPNPNQGEFKISGLPYQKNENLFIEITDILGKIVYSDIITAGHNNPEIKLNGMQNGVYLLRVHSGQSNEIQRVLIQN